MRVDGRNGTGHGTRGGVVPDLADNPAARPSRQITSSRRAPFTDSSTSTATDGAVSGNSRDPAGATAADRPATRRAGADGRVAAFGLGGA
jgi:hypothetical protein